MATMTSTPRALRAVEETPYDGASDSLSAILSDIGRYPLLSRSDEVRLARGIETGDEAAKRELIDANRRLVVAVAKDFRRDGVAFRELIDQGMDGLARAAEGFDWRLGIPFAPYAGWWIRTTIRAHLRFLELAS